MPTQYYKVHGGRLSVAEYWRLSPDPLSFAIAVCLKPFGGFPFNFSIPRVDELHTREWTELPGVARRALTSARDRLERAGCELVVCHELPVLEGHRLGVGAAFLAPGGQTFVAANFAKDQATSKVEVVCVSRFEDDVFGMTTTAKKQLKPRPDYIADRHPGVPADDLLDRHRENLGRWEADGRRPRRYTPQTLPAVILEGEQLTVDFHAERGVFVPMSKAEIRRAGEAADDEAG